MMSSLTEHTWKCLKVKYLGRIEYDVQKSRVTGPWDHKDLVSAKKLKTISCLCTFKGFPRGQSRGDFFMCYCPTTFSTFYFSKHYEHL
jgi:hypothetical protein